jgi:hypothetical protein
MYTYITHSHKNGSIDVSTVFQIGLKSVWNIATCVNVHLKALFDSFKMIYNMHMHIFIYKKCTTEWYNQTAKL